MKTLGRIMAGAMVLGIIANVLDQPLILLVGAVIVLVFGGLSYVDR